MSFSAAEILNFENYCALAVSVYSEKLCGPEIAFERMGMNIFTDINDKQKYTWKINGDKLWRDMDALREIGWSWSEIADYFDMSYGTALSVYCRCRRRYTGIKKSLKPGRRGRKKRLLERNEGNETD